MTTQEYKNREQDKAVDSGISLAVFGGGVAMTVKLAILDHDTLAETWFAYPAGGDPFSVTLGETQTICGDPTPEQRETALQEIWKASST